MRYLILAAGMGRRLGDAGAGLPKCLIDVDGETLISRILRQIRRVDRDADIRVVLGYRSERVTPLVDGCRIVINPFFEVAGINASLWLAREAFDAPVMLLHGDVVLAEDLATRLLAATADSLMAFDSAIRDPREINVAVENGRIVRFDEDFAGYSGMYAGMLKLSRRSARVFAGELDRRVREGFSRPRDYYFFAVRAIIDACRLPILAFDIAGQAWQEIDRAEHIAAARARLAGGGTPGYAFQVAPGGCGTKT